MPIIIFILIFIAFIVVIFYIEWKRLQQVKTEWKPNDRDQAVDMLIDDFKRANKRVLIYGGNSDIYHEEDIVNSIKDALARNVNIEIICEITPIDIAKFQVDSYKKHGYLSSGVTHRKAFRHHFRVVDYDYVYIEKPHPVGSHDRWYKRLYNVRFLPGDYSDEFYKIRESAFTDSP